MLVTEIDRFMKFVSPEPNSGCWLWTGTWGTGGYGDFRPTRSKRMERAHRTAYRLLRGPIPEGLQLDHLCRVRCCVNPAHLEPVTSAENIRRGRTGENMRSKTHCPQGHEYSPANTYHDRTGRRHCNECRRLDAAFRYSAKRKAGFRRVKDRWIAE